jgi:hypothetical protein
MMARGMNMAMYEIESYGNQKIEAANVRMYEIGGGWKCRMIDPKKGPASFGGVA